MEIENKDFNIVIGGAGAISLGHMEGIDGCEGVKLVGYTTDNADKASGDFSKVDLNLGIKGRKDQVNPNEVIIKPNNGLGALIDEARERFGSVDAAFIDAPTDKHITLARKALDQGVKNVFVEKPASLSASEAAKLSEYARSKGRKLAIGTELPAFQEFAMLLEDLKAAGVEGTESLVMERYLASSALADKEMTERVGGWATDLAPHDIGLVVNAFGIPAQVSATGRYYEGFSAPQYLEIKLHYQDAEGNELPADIQIKIGVNESHSGFFHGYDCSTNNNSVSFNKGDAKGVERNGKAVSVNQGIEDVFKHEVGTVVAFFKGEIATALNYDFDDHVGTLRVLEAALKSATLGGCRVKPYTSA